MKKFLPLALFMLCIGLTNQAAAQSKPKLRPKRAFAHNSEARRGKNDKAHFRSESKRPIIDLTPHKSTTFKTAKANKPYKFSKGNGFGKAK
ncbi:hypothetical protein [Hymenobacter terricola]|uniref:hypothetical protein n=1 Tax=Hymenobacter terricola TaxID=2819236 RepID=UPI001B312EB4|nr:hypothetical protein [Hymenobacter terricola]